MERNFSPELPLEFGRESNFNRLVMEDYGCEHSWRQTVMAWMAATLLRGYKGDESMIDGLRCYGGMYFYRLGGGWLHDRFNLVLICYNPILSIRNSNKLETKSVACRSNLVLICYNPILSVRNTNKLKIKSVT
jgi:hypothetical protein